MRAMLPQFVLEGGWESRKWDGLKAVPYDNLEFR